MKVRFKNNWFGPDGTLYRASRSPHSLPNDWKEKLPKSAEVLDEGEHKVPETPKKK